MSKKIVALCTLLSINLFVSANGYPASGGYQVSEDHHGHHHSEKNALKKQKLDALNQQLKDLTRTQESLTNTGTITTPRICLGVALLGVAVGAIGQDGKSKAAGAVLFLGGGALAVGTAMAEESKRTSVAEEIKQVTEAITKI